MLARKPSGKTADSLPPLLYNSCLYNYIVPLPQSKGSALYSSTVFFYFFFLFLRYFPKFCIFSCIFLMSQLYCSR